MGTLVASANVLGSLSRGDAGRALDLVLGEEPDLVALQEWYPSRLGLLLRRGEVRLVPSMGLPVLGSGPPGSAYRWVATLGDGNVVGARADRYELLDARAVRTVGPSFSDRTERRLSLEPPRFLAVGVFADRRSGTTVALVGYHFSAGVQAGGRYRDDRPRLAARHRAEVGRLAELVAELTAAGHQVRAAGDSNFDGLRLPWLTSAWAGREDEPGTFGAGTRKIDDVHGPGPVLGVRRLVTGSDHQAILVSTAD